MRTCSEPDCSRRHAAKGFCKVHYYQLRDVGPCSVEGCEQRRLAKGYCRYHWRTNRDSNRVCLTCGATFTGDPRRTYCSDACRGVAKRHPLRNALDNGDLPTILRVAQESSDITEDDCWLWRFAKNSAGYPMLGQGGSGGLVHRRMVETFLGRAIGREPVHHKCANSACINPDHLQLTTQRENMAEMFARNFYIARIAELELALLRASSPVGDST